MLADSQRLGLALDQIVIAALNGQLAVRLRGQPTWPHQSIGYSVSVALVDWPIDATEHLMEPMAIATSHMLRCSRRQSSRRLAQVPQLGLITVNCRSSLRA